MLRLYLRLASALVTLCAVSCAAQAQDAVEGRETEFYVQTSHGAPEVCGLEFTLVYRDHSYKQGARAGVTGSLAWLESKGNVGLLLKIMGSDFGNSATPVPFQVFDGLVFVDGKPLLPQTAISCEQSTGYCGSYSLQNSVEIYSALVPPRRVAIAFARQPKGLDITLGLDIPVETFGSRQFQQFNDCVGALTQRAMNNLRQ